jgi:hypothetical protein
MFCNNKPQNGIPQKFEPLIIGLASMTRVRHIGFVGERVLQEVYITEAIIECGLKFIEISLG